MSKTESSINLGTGVQLTEQGARFRVWAPDARAIKLLIEQAEPQHISLKKQADGYFIADVPDVKAGTRYRYLLNGEQPCPDPCARFQPEGPHGPSMIVDPQSYVWRDDGWRGATMAGQVIYEMHIGAFTREGTFDAA